MDEVRLALDRSPAAPRQARQGLREWLGGLSCPDRIKDDVLVVVSELVTNAVVHARSEPVVVALYDDGRLRIEVHDDDRTPPVVLPSVGPTGGFGMRLVDGMCDAWGWVTTDTGKAVWTETLC